MHAPARAIVVASTALLLALSGCGGGDEDSGSGSDSGSDSGAHSTKSTTKDEGRGTLRTITSCDQIAPLVATWIGGLPLTDDSYVNKDGWGCGWAVDEPTSFDDIRMVSVTGESGKFTDVEPDYLAEHFDMLIYKSPQLTAMGGYGYGLATQTALAGAVVTSIETPHAKITVTGGKWGKLPALDGNVAMDIALKLLNP